MSCAQQATMMVSSFDEIQSAKLAQRTVSVLVADDTRLMRRTICGFLRGRLEIEIVGEAADYTQTVQLANDLRPQVIVMDLHLACQPNITPLDVKTQLNHGSRLVAISVADDDEAKALAESFGAVAFLDKMKLFDELIPTILRFA
jgi:DNA-binding NarL/FixJ family response regulator